MPARFKTGPARLKTGRERVVSSAVFCPVSPPAPLLAPAARPPFSVPLELTLQLMTRFCHDLSGPIGALCAGVELLSDGDDGFLQETAALLRTSTDGAVARLKFLRAALGVHSGVQGGVQGGVSGGGARSGDSPSSLLSAYVRAQGGTHLSSSWQIPADSLSASQQQLAYSLALLGCDGLNGNGHLQLSLSPCPSSSSAPSLGSQRLEVTLSGPKVGFSDEQSRALQDPSAPLSPRSAVASFCRYFAAFLGCSGIVLASIEGETVRGDGEVLNSPRHRKVQLTCDLPPQAG